MNVSFVSCDDAPVSIDDECGLVAGVHGVLSVVKEKVAVQKYYVVDSDPDADYKYQDIERADVDDKQVLVVKIFNLGSGKDIRITVDNSGPRLNAPVGTVSIHKMLM